MLTTDGNKSTSGVEKALIGQTYKARETAGYWKHMIIHCIIHQQGLCGKYLNPPGVLELAHIVNDGFH